MNEHAEWVEFLNRLVTGLTEVITKLDTINGNPPPPGLLAKYVNKLQVLNELCIETLAVEMELAKEGEAAP